jgi:hypothetical protein
MSEVNVRLGASGKDQAIFYDLRYTNDLQGGNHTETMFEIKNLSGNGICVETALYATNKRTNRTELVWEPALDGCDGIRITFRGSCENDEFLRMLQLILEAEKMVSIIKP